jgi:hypothetical protein
MEAIGQLTAGVGYHFSVMLQGIVGNLDLAAMDARRRSVRFWMMPRTMRIVPPASYAS